MARGIHSGDGALRFGEILGAQRAIAGAARLDARVAGIATAQTCDSGECGRLWLSAGHSQSPLCGFSHFSARVLSASMASTQAVFPSAARSCFQNGALVLSQSMMN